MRTPGLLVLALVAVAGCLDFGGDDTSILPSCFLGTLQPDGTCELCIIDPCGPPLPTPVDQFAAGYAQAQCEYLAGCGELAVGDLGTCEAIVGRQHDFAGAVAAVQAGHSTYDGMFATDCLQILAGDQLGADVCDAASTDARSRLAACDLLFVGGGEPGATCADDAECRSGGCALPCDGVSTCCTGSCEAPAAAISASCIGTHGCVTGAFCDPTGTCLPLQPIGGGCTVDTDCAAELACVTTAGVGACHATAAEGADCTTAPCAAVEDRCSPTSHTCVRSGLTGATCASTADCGATLTCDAATSTCIELPVLGQPCGAAGCGGYAYCAPAALGVPTTCVPLVQDGGECHASADCNSDYCDAATDLCADEPVCI